MLISVQVHPGCYNKIPRTRKNINSENLLLIILKSEKSKLEMLADLVSGKALVSSVHLYMGKERREKGANKPPWSSFTRALS